MANFVAVVDPDPERRERFLADAGSLLHLLPGLASSACAAPRFGAAWALGPRAPVSHESDDRGASVLFGDALGRGGVRVDAPRLRAEWHAPGAPVPAVLDGYHAGVAYAADRGVVCGVDLLGWYPLYWFARGDALVMASSPELVARHPLCHAALDPAALAGLLLLNGLAGAGALLSPIRRLAAGHLLAWSPERGAREIRQYAPPSAWAGEDLPWEAYVARFHAVMADTMRRHVAPGRRCGLLLSGGLDSRMLAGYLHAQGTEVEALTQGVASDTEMQCAVGVAGELGVAHRLFEVPGEHLPRYVELQSRWEHLSSGFSSVLDWGRVPALSAMPERVVAGYGLAHVLHANSVVPAEALAAGALPFEAAFGLRNTSGLAPDALRRLLRPDGGRDLVGSVLEELAARHAGLATSDFRRYWASTLSGHVRHHIGSLAWRTCFGSWPVLPVLDRALLDAVASMPVAALSGRRLQHEIMCTRFPELAALPLDRESDDSTPLRPRARYVVRRSVADRLARLRRQLTGRRPERQSVRRIDNVNGPAWRAVRHLAEPHRPRLHALMDPITLDELLPPPDVDLRAGRGRATPGGAKLLLGLMLWADGRL